MALIRGRSSTSTDPVGRPGDWLQSSSSMAEPSWTGIGPEEALAWKRRNDAAHGNEMEAGVELSLIQDNKLLKVVFHRMLLRITNASDLYFDYATPGFPMRRLIDPASSRD
jgi:hypothetical protein